LRTEMRAEAASRRSIEAIRRLKIPLDGAKVAVAVLDIWVPFLERGDAPRYRLGANLGIPDASDNRFVCIAAIWRVQCNINGLIEFPNTKRPPERPAAFKSKNSSRKRRLFSCHLARRIERAGIVDLGDLVVAKAEHLTQDFVGVFAH
jgi:hypothetical protein